MKKNKTLIQNSLSVLLAAAIGLSPVAQKLYGEPNFEGVNLDNFSFAAFSSSKVSDSDNIWKVLANRFRMNYNSVDRVQQQIEMFKKHQDYVTEMTKNARPYIYFVTQETAKRGLPAELALVPMIESSYNPFDTSRCGATGLWQMMKNTASGYGLKTTTWIEGRKNVTKSTDAALAQLNYLHNTFKDWLLALAAYNAGEGTVSKAIKYNQKHNKPTDYWSLPLPMETKIYVPKILALAAVLKNPQQYNLKVEPIANKPYFTEIDVTNKRIDLRSVARVTQMDVKQIRKLNPALRQSVTPPTGAYALLVPIEKADVVEKQLTSLAEESSTMPKIVFDDSASVEKSWPTPRAKHVTHLTKAMSHKRAKHKHSNDTETA